MKKKTAAEQLYELYDLMEIEDQKAYQSKMKGFILPFFYSHSKQHPDGYLTLNNKKLLLI